jgi:hypothetical protein
VRDENLVRRERRCAMKPDPCCPKCGYTMCELFDYVAQASPVPMLAATANGRYQCSHCSAVTSVACWHL